MKNPCAKDCPDRAMGCHQNCERYKPYREWYEKMNAERQKKFLVDSFQIENMEKTKRRTSR